MRCHLDPQCCLVGLVLADTSTTMVWPKPLADISTISCFGPISVAWGHLAELATCQYCDSLCSLWSGFCRAWASSGSGNSTERVRFDHGRFGNESLRCQHPRVAGALHDLVHQRRDVSTCPNSRLLVNLSGPHASLILSLLIRYDNPLGRTFQLFFTFSRQEGTRDIRVNDMIEEYNELHDDRAGNGKKTGDSILECMANLLSATGGVANRNSSYTTLVNSYYELATSFYEWGWGQSFHFAYRLKGEDFYTSIRRHEYYLASQIGVKKDDRVLDVGCGIGGPMRNIAKFSQAHVTGITLNEYQVGPADHS